LLLGLTEAVSSNTDARAPKRVRRLTESSCAIAALLGETIPFAGAPTVSSGLPGSCRRPADAGTFLERCSRPNPDATVGRKTSPMRGPQLAFSSTSWLARALLAFFSARQAALLADSPWRMYTTIFAPMGRRSTSSVSSEPRFSDRRHFMRPPAAGKMLDAGAISGKWSQNPFVCRAADISHKRLRCSCERQ
jgi:hypothetical protein